MLGWQTEVPGKTWLVLDLVQARLQPTPLRDQVTMVQLS